MLVHSNEPSDISRSPHLGSWSACRHWVAAHHGADADHVAARPLEPDRLFSEAGIILHFLRRRCP